MTICVIFFIVLARPLLFMTICVIFFIVLARPLLLIIKQVVTSTKTQIDMRMTFVWWKIWIFLIQSESLLFRPHEIRTFFDCQKRHQEFQGGFHCFYNYVANMWWQPSLGLSLSEKDWATFFSFLFKIVQAVAKVIVVLYSEVKRTLFGLVHVQYDVQYDRFLSQECEKRHACIIYFELLPNSYFFQCQWNYAPVTYIHK